MESARPVHLVLSSFSYLCIHSLHHQPHASINFLTFRPRESIASRMDARRDNASKFPSEMLAVRGTTEGKANRPFARWNAVRRNHGTEGPVTKRRKLGTYDRGMYNRWREWWPTNVFFVRNSKEIVSGVFCYSIHHIQSRVNVGQDKVDKRQTRWWMESTRVLCGQIFAVIALFPRYDRFRISQLQSFAYWN